MKLMYGFGSGLALLTVLTLGGCENMNNPSSNSDYGTSDHRSDYGRSDYGRSDYRSSDNRSSDYGNGNQTIYSGYGVVQSIELVRQESSGNGGVGIGTIAGAVVGGVVGSQVGSGHGSTAASIIGAAGGAYIGHELENRQQTQTADVYSVRVRMENGSTQTLLLSNNPDLRVGDRVRISNGMMERY
ncbi:glycine zipper 2TM domain-containing protein [Marinobacterium sedimentorum]|uniref:glycine zipper 2TM domain-containing protein n=1 Tax=Marinobacterium sedimentorum TaxID=2927804 RepID=UPI0020C5C032|nr:glycine zipper 2TM domain-containing protein [Marinobacterium sedimentorum]MCP8687479.1 glycine zipper 2TM domain-containing protein [Marinobacterium sedimentorum]